jgi:hypothetical protein
MGLTMSQRKAVTKATATRYWSSSRAAKARVLDELCELTGQGPGKVVVDGASHDDTPVVV